MARNSTRAQWAAHIKRLQAGQAAPKTGPVAIDLNRRHFRGCILGIDPSLRGTGLAILRFEQPGQGVLLHSETLKPPRTAGLPECLGGIAVAVARLMQHFKPDAVAVEETIYVQNLRTAQKLGAARGAAIGQAALCGCPVFEYPPLRIKQAVVGYGHAGKDQVARQMASLLNLPGPLPLDEADAAATAFCHAMTLGREPVQPA